MRPATITRSVRHRLTPDELAVVATDLTEALSERAQIDDDRKAAAAEFGARLKTTQAHIDELTRLYRARSETRQVECEILWDTPEVGSKTIRRLDNGETVAVERMTDAERQQELPLEDGPLPDDEGLPGARAELARRLADSEQDDDVAADDAVPEIADEDEQEPAEGTAADPGEITDDEPEEDVWAVHKRRGDLAQPLCRIARNMAHSRPDGTISDAALHLVHRCIDEYLAPENRGRDEKWLEDLVRQRLSVLPPSGKASA